MGIKIDIVQGADAGYSQVFNHQPIRVGRQTGNDVNLNDNSISGAHCMFSEEGARIFITDLNSKNGAFVNDHRVVAKTPIFPNDIIRIGGTIMRVEFVQTGFVQQPVQAPPHRPQSPSLQQPHYSQPHPVPPPASQPVQNYVQKAESERSASFWKGCALYGCIVPAIVFLILVLTSSLWGLILGHSLGSGSFEALRAFLQRWGMNI